MQIVEHALDSSGTQPIQLHRLKFGLMGSGRDKRKKQKGKTPGVGAEKTGKCKAVGLCGLWSHTLQTAHPIRLMLQPPRQRKSKQSEQPKSARCAAGTPTCHL